MKRSISNNNKKNNNIYNNENIEIKRITPKSISLNKDRDRYNRNINNYNAVYTFNQKNSEKEQNDNNNNNLFDEITNYEIESTSKNITESQRNTNKNKPFTYTEQLESKIQEQAKRLSDLSKYKILCEKRLRELNPNEKIPLSEDSIKTLSKKSSNNEIEINTNKYNILYDKYQKLKKLYHELSKNQNNSNRSSNTSESNFNIEKYKKLKERYKILKNENSKLVELLQKETIATEEQKNIISILQQTIDNDLIKSGNINKYINSNNIFDFTKLKNEAEEYRKELILSQALVNSLKSEIELINKEKEEEEKRKKNTINLLSSSETFDNNSINNNKYLSINKNDNDNLFEDENNNLMNKKNLNENDNLISTINSQKKFISELLKKNSELEQLVNNASYKLNEGINLNNNAKDKMKSFELEIQNKKNELSQYEEKFTYFNDYISSIKSSLSQLQSFLNDYIGILNKMANEDLNSHLTKNFSENVNLLKNKMSLISKVEKYNLDIDNDLNIINSAINTLTIINDEFVNIYEKIFQSDNYYKESNKKLENLQNKFDSTNQNLETQKENMNFISGQLDQKVKENLNIKQSNDNLNERNFNLNFEIAKLKSDINLINSDKNRLLDFIQIICKINSITDMKVSELIRQGISLIENISKLREEKNEIERKLNKINLGNQKNIILSNNDKDLNQIICNEQNNLKQLINEIERKINENEIQFDELKKELNCLYNMYNSYGDNNKFIYNNQYNNNNIFQIKKSRPENLNGINSNFNKKNSTKSNTENYNFTYGTTNTLEQQYKKYIDSHSNYNNTNNTNYQNSCINYSNGNKMTYQVIQTTPH